MVEKNVKNNDKMQPALKELSLGNIENVPITKSIKCHEKPVSNKPKLSLSNKENSAPY